MQRVVDPEILDSLSHDDPAARASRRDLRLINLLMGNFRWFAGKLRSAGSGSVLIELGAGDGGLGVYLKRHHSLSAESDYTGVDLIPRPAEWPSAWRWAQTDLLEVNLQGCTTLLANLILHQLGDGELNRLGQAISESGIRTLLINEPVRRPLHLWQIALSRLLRVHPVTLHDARISIRAGFRGDEVGCLLQLDRKEWTLTHSETFMGANRIIGHRK